MIYPISFTNAKQEESIASGSIGFNFEALMGEGIPLDDSINTSSATSAKPKKKNKETKKLSNGDEIILANTDNQIQTNDPYIDSYNITNNMLKSTLNQIDTISSELKVDLDMLRGSKTIKNKYTYIPNIASTLGALMSTKVTAIREINKSITDSHNLELKRTKELGLDKDIDDDKAIMDLYNTFISMPQSNGSVGGMMSPHINDMTLMNGVQNMVRTSIGTPEYDNSIINSNVFNRMRYERDPNVKTVVVYNQATGARYFDVMNVKTGESIPNVDRPDAMFLEDTIIDLNNRIARNTNLDQTYDLIVIGDNLSKY